MERMDIKDQKGILYKEHICRYEFIKPLVSGVILDVACGVGYGSQIIYDKIDQYVGIDYSSQAIEDAKKYFQKGKIDFIHGDIAAIKSKENNFDTIISFETLEHIEQYDKALSELYRVLKKDGLFIGSVPSVEYDEICEKVYGKNQFHVTRFDLNKIKKLLFKYFKNVEFFSSELMICNTFKKLSQKKLTKVDYDDFKSDNIYGSIIFIASNNKELFNRSQKKLQNIVYSFNRLVEYDLEKVYPLTVAIWHAEEAINERDKAIAAQEKMINERDKAIAAQEKMINERDKAITAQEKMINERDYYIKMLERKLNEKK